MYAPVYSQDINSKLKWKSEIPQVANDPQKWIELIQEFEEYRRPYAALAAGMRMLLLFPDVASQKFAYETIIKGIDLGYPNSLLHLFIIGNLEIDGIDELSQNYNFL